MTPPESKAYEVSHLRRDVEEMKADMRELKGEVKELVKAWEAATGLLRFIKWSASIVAACGVLVAAMKYWFRG